MPSLEIAEEIKKFINSCEKSFKVKSVYLEMNGFDINPDRWYFAYFAYDSYGEIDDFEWLCDRKSERWSETDLTGLEKVQKDYDWYSNQKGYNDPLAYEASEYATLLVMVKFVCLIQKAIKTGKINIPILATAHDFDIIARFNG